MKDLSLHILDIFQNSVRAKATEIKVEVQLSVMGNRFEFTIEKLVWEYLFYIIMLI